MDSNNLFEFINIPFESLLSWLITHNLLSKYTTIDSDNNNISRRLQSDYDQVTRNISYFVENFYNKFSEKQKQILPSPSITLVELELIYNTIIDNTGDVFNNIDKSTSILKFNQYNDVMLNLIYKTIQKFKDNNLFLYYNYKFIYQSLTGSIPNLGDLINKYSQDIITFTNRVTAYSNKCNINISNYVNKLNNYHILDNETDSSFNESTQIDYVKYFNLMLSKLANTYYLLYRKLVDIFFSTSLSVLSETIDFYNYYMNNIIISTSDDNKDKILYLNNLSSLIKDINSCKNSDVSTVFNNDMPSVFQSLSILDNDSVADSKPHDDAKVSNSINWDYTNVAVDSISVDNMQYDTKEELTEKNDNTEQNKTDNSDINWEIDIISTDISEEIDANKNNTDFNGNKNNQIVIPASIDIKLLPTINNGNVSSIIYKPIIDSLIHTKRLKYIINDLYELLSFCKTIYKEYNNNNNGKNDDTNINIITQLNQNGSIQFTSLPNYISNIESLLSTLISDKLLTELIYINTSTKYTNSLISTELYNQYNNIFKLKSQISNLKENISKNSTLIDSNLIELKNSIKNVRKVLNYTNEYLQKKFDNKNLFITENITNRYNNLLNR